MATFECIFIYVDNKTTKHKQSTVESSKFPHPHILLSLMYVLSFFHLKTQKQKQNTCVGM